MQQCTLSKVTLDELGLEDESSLSTLDELGLEFIVASEVYHHQVQNTIFPTICNMAAFLPPPHSSVL